MSARLLRKPALAFVFVFAATASLLASACAETGTGPEEAAAIELAPFPSPSIVIGDTLRDAAGNVALIQAIVRNVKGDIIADAPVRFLYADYPRDSALIVDSSGLVRAVRVATGDARIAAQIGGSLQVLRKIVITTRPDSIDSSANPALFTTTLGDTGRVAVNQNTSAELTVTVRHKQDSTVTPVNAWLVRFSIVRPASSSANDSTDAVFLVDDAGRPSTLDTTNSGGTASRRVRIRAAQFPSGTTLDSVIVQASASYRGVPLKGSPVQIVLPVQRGN